MKKMLLSLLIPAALALPACTDEQVAASVGFVGGVLVGSTIDSYHGNSPYYGCSSYRNYWGGWTRDCGYGYNYGYGYGDYYGWGYYSAQGKKAVSYRAVKFAEKNGTSLAAGERIVRAFDNGKRGDFANLDKLGLERSELMRIANGEMPTSRAIAKMSRELDLHSSQVNKLMKRVIRVVEQKRSRM